MAQKRIEDKRVNEDLLALTHGGENPARYLHAVVPPVFMNSLHVYETSAAFRGEDASDEHYVYGRVSNPTVEIAEAKVAELEHAARAAMFASGMAAATSAIMATCQTGSHIVCQKNCYGPVKTFINNLLVPSFGMTVTYVSCLDLAELEAAIRPETSLMILESPATLVFSVIDIAEITKIAKKHGVRTYIDNSYCTPIFQKPLDLGVDIVMHTMSKYIGGHSDIIGGVLASKDEALMEKITRQTRELFGGIIGPMEGWLVIRGLRTLDVRVRQHERNAMTVAAWLEKNPRVRCVHYTGLASHPQADIVKKQQTGSTGLLSFELDGTGEHAVKFVDSLRLFGKGVSWGGFESLALASLSKATDEDLAFLGLTPESRGMVRIHCGLEGAENLLEDMEQAFQKTFG
jgi:cystathionine gamma-lyase